MFLADFHCPSCNKTFEELVDSSNTETCKCPLCQDGVGTKIFEKSAHVCTEIIPTYPGCKRQKAGYTHTSHADQPATKIQSGYGGCQGPPI